MTSTLAPTPPRDTAPCFWRKDDPVIDEKGAVVTGGMFAHQRQWWNFTDFLKVFVGGYGSGKTVIGCKWAISMALHNAPHPIAVVSPTFKVARNTLISTLTELLAGKRTVLGRSFGYQYHASYHEFTIRYHGRVGKIIIYSGDDPQSLRGPNIAAALLDECFLMDFEVFTQMLARVRHPDAKTRQIGLVGTPEQLNWGYDLCMGELKDAGSISFVQADSKMNQALPADYVKTLRGYYSEKAAEAYISGRFVNLAEGLVYYSFSPSNNIKEVPTPEGAEYGCGMDFNVNPMAACVFWRHQNHMHVVEEIELPNADTQFMCGTLRDKYGDKIRDIYPDATGSRRQTSSPGGKSDFWYLRNAGYTVRAHGDNPHRKDRFNAVNGKLKPVEGETALTIDPGCKRLTKYLMTYSHEEVMKQKDMSHLLDAMGYPVAFLWPVVHNSLKVMKVHGI